MSRVYRGPPYCISTETYTSAFDSPIDLFTVYNFLEIDKQFLGMLYGGKIRGDYRVKGRPATNSNKLPNQISMTIHPPGFSYAENKGVNVKLFSNGSVQMTGCKMPPGTPVRDDTQQFAVAVADKILDLLFHKLYSLNGTYTEPVEIHCGFLVGINSGRLYTQDRRFFGTRILWKDNQTPIFVIDKKNVDPKTRTEIEFENGMRKTYDVEGNVVKIQKIVFKDEFQQYAEMDWAHKKATCEKSYLIFERRNRVNLHPDEDNPGEFLLLDRFNSTCVGRTVSEKIAQPAPDNIAATTPVEISTPFAAFFQRENCRINPAQLFMSNSYYSLGVSLDLLRTAQLLQQWNIEVIYNPDKYHGLKIYYYPNDECVCMKTECKCKTSIFVFSTGSVMISTNNLKDMRNSYSTIADLVDQNYNEVVKSFTEKTRKRKRKLQET